MLGHKIMQVLSRRYSVTGTLREDPSELSENPVFASMHLIGNIRADDITSIRDVITQVKPDVVLNCIGIVKQLPAAQDPLASIAINALFPHQLAAICRSKNIRLIHVSTDCVFSGRKGCYTENDLSDAEDLYGRTKFLGEVSYPGCLTIRTSIIGRELGTAHGLVEWFLGQQGKTVPGFKNAIFSGLTTNALAEIVGEIISSYPDLCGIVQVASRPICKHDLLVLIRRVYGMKIDIIPDETVINNRSLDAQKFRTETKIKIPSWEYMIEEMYRDSTRYQDLRGHHAQK